jgi:two-component system CheB/CheR fusion protein
MTATALSRGQSVDSFPVVAIGASAGGLEAFLVLFRSLVAPTNMAFVLVTHLEPTHQSELVKIISGNTSLVVLEAHDQTRIEREHLYIMPPNADLEISDGLLRLIERTQQKPHYPIDHFFESLAKDQGSKAIGIILSGGGFDGAAGVRAINSRDGVTFCQDPKTAMHSGMPHSAISTGVVDRVLAPAEIGEALNQLSTHVSLPKEGTSGDLEPFPDDHQSFLRIIDMLRASHLVDFNQYKPSTLSRRIGRRVVVHHLDSFAEYANFLEGHPLELDQLYRDILICVTSFFREPAVFEALSPLIAHSFEGRKTSDPYRVWIAGCATGEEAYSFAIVVRETMEAACRQFPIQVFGTDISDSAIDRARGGIFSEQIEKDVSPERLRKFFKRIDPGYKIAETVRENCIFARHDITSDPPFSQLDIISCRNVMIYFGSAVQSRVLPNFHYGLKPAGLLVLGSAETVGSRSDIFATANDEHKVFAKKAVPAHLDLSKDPSIPNLPPIPQLSVSQWTVPLDLEGRASRILAASYAPAGVIINSEMQILHFQGVTSFYLEPASGEATLNLLRLAPESLVYPLRALVERAVETKSSVEQTGIRVERHGETRNITLRVIPLSEKAPAYLVLFEEPVKQNGPQSPARQAASQTNLPQNESQLGQAHQEILQMRDYLRRFNEEYEATNEELRAANEEARSSNEELQSTNEELRTAKEELQSSNEELITVNDELKQRNDDLRRASDDLANVLTAAAIPIVMVDRNSCLRRFTPAAQRLLGLSPADIGQPLHQVNQAFSPPSLPKMLKAALELLASQSERSQNRQGRWYEIFVRPYRTADDHIEGAVVSFIDVDNSTRALEDAEHSRNFAEAVIETVQHPMLILDQDLRILRATDAFYQTFNVKRLETEGQLISDIGAGQWNFPELRRLLETALVRDVPFKDLDVEHEFPKIGRRTMRLNARRIIGTSQRQRLLLAIEDVTERKETAEIQYRRLFESARDAILIVEAASGNVIDVNPYFTELTRYPRAELVGKRLADLRVFLESDEIRRLLPDLRTSPSLRHQSVKVTARDGTSLILEIIGNVYNVRNQEFIQVNIRDVTERRRIEDQLRSSNLDLQQFAFATSHDLQEPLRTVSIFSERIKAQLEGKANAEISRQFDFILAAAARMRQMVLDLLGYAQIVRADLNASLVNTEAVLSSVLLSLQMAIDSCQAQVSFDHLPPVFIDQTHLGQLLQNLISNAIKYRSNQTPRIHLSARDAGREWIFSVTDNGIGIDPQYVEHIFTIFKRLHGSKYPGSGIGLAICKRVVERYDGRIWVEANPTGGSIFSFSLPKDLPA